MRSGPEEIWCDMAVGYLRQRLHHGVQEGSHPYSHLQQLQHCGKHVRNMVTAALANSVPLPRATDYRKRNMKSRQVFSISCYSPRPFYIAPGCLDTIKIPWIAASPTLRLGERVIVLPAFSFPHLICVGLISSSFWLSCAVTFPALGLLSHFHTWFTEELIYTSLPEGCISN